MLSIKLRLIVPNHLIKNAVLCRLGSTYQIITRIRRSDVVEDSVWMRLEMRGEPDDVEQAISNLGAIGVSVAPIEGDIVH
jgi:hypothetical protein